jgi:hypothetical protein
MHTCCKNSHCPHFYARDCCQQCRHSIADRSPSPLSDIDLSHTRYQLRLSKAAKKRMEGVQRRKLQKSLFIFSQTTWSIRRAAFDGPGYRGKSKRDTVISVSDANLTSGESSETDSHGTSKNRLDNLLKEGYKYVPFRQVKSVFSLKTLISFYQIRPYQRLLVDIEGYIVGFILPPNFSDKRQMGIWRAMEIMRDQASEKASPYRGNFMVMTYGIQKGKGTKVCICTEIRHMLMGLRFQDRTPSQNRKAKYARSFFPCLMLLSIFQNAEVCLQFVVCFVSPLFIL